LEILRELAAARITLHTQVVLCPGLNDGAVLEKTASELASLYPWVASLAVVPVGLTAHRDRLPPLQSVTAAYAAAFVHEWQPQSERLARELGEPFLFLADEFFLKAGIPFPALKSYGDFPQWENGVGMVPLFRADAARVLRRTKYLGDGDYTVVTGVAAFPVIHDFLVQLAERAGVRIRVVAVENRLFGPDVTVAGLVTGRDIISALLGRELGWGVMVPDVMLKEGEGIFLDDLTIDDLWKRLGVPVIVSASSPSGIYTALRRASAQRKGGTRR
jgi:putative radical SAM enzyme (TIGR03279 family)